MKAAWALAAATGNEMPGEALAVYVWPFRASGLPQRPGRVTLMVFSGIFQSAVRLRWILMGMVVMLGEVG